MPATKYWLSCPASTCCGLNKMADILQMLAIVFRPQSVNAYQRWDNRLTQFLSLSNYLHHSITWPLVANCITTALVISDVGVQQWRTCYFYDIGASNCWYSQFSHKYSQKTLHISPVRARYGVSFVDSASDGHSVWVPVIIIIVRYYYILQYWTRVITAINCTQHFLHFTFSSLDTPQPINTHKTCTVEIKIYVNQKEFSNLEFDQLANVLPTN